MLPVNPFGPVGPVAPTNPVAPVFPVEPILPAGPVFPVDPIRPTDPVFPVAPIGPVGPGVPTQDIRGPISMHYAIVFYCRQSRYIQYFAIDSLNIILDDSELRQIILAIIIYAKALLN